MKKSLKILAPVGGGVVLLIIVLWMAGVFQSGQIPPGTRAAPPGMPAPKSTLKVTVESSPAGYEAVGTVRSRIEATVAPQITGQLLSVKVNVGDRVAQGDTLVTLDSQEYQARFEQARSSLVAAEAERVRANANFERIQKLFDQKAATSEHLEGADAQKKQADAAVITAQQKVKEAETFLGYTKLSCPLDGLVSARHADPGDLAYPGKPLLVIHKPTDLRLEAGVREGLIARVRAMQESGTDAEVRLSTLQKTVRGKISEIVPSADPVSRSFIVKVDLPSTEGLYPGMFGKLRVALDPRASVTVPAECVARVGQLATVRVLQDEKWVRRFVTLGARTGDKVEVLSGLANGETIGWN